MEKRPQIKVKLNSADRIVNFAGLAVLLLLWTVVAWNYQQLPQTIPVHFDFSGKPDNYGYRTSIFTLPVVGTILFVVLSVLNRFPHVFNYGVVTITNENALEHYTAATRMLRYLKLSIALVFLLIVLYTTETAHGTTGNAGKWLVPLLIALVFLPLIFFVIRLIRKPSR